MNKGYQMYQQMFTVLIVIVLTSVPVRAQWQWGSPVPQGNDLWSAAIAPGTASVWAAGAAGIIVRSSDGGATWSVQESGRDDILRGVDAIDASTAWVVGDNGAVLKTLNGGATWTSQNSGTTAGINTVYAVSSTTAFLVGDAGMLHATTNGGTTWIARSTGSGNNLNGVHFTDAMHGVAVGSSATILQTTNGGASWTPRSVSPGMLSADLIDVYFVDADYGWAVGSGGTVIRTTNGGTNWSKMNNNGTAADLNKVRFADRQTGWTVGEGGALYRSSNGGGNWTAITTGTTYGLEGMDLQGGTTVAVGLYGDILRSTNGTSFTLITSGPRASVNAVTAAIPSSAWAVDSDGGILATNNGGMTWQSVSTTNVEPLFGIDNINGQVIVACGNGGVILRSTNAGATWNTIPSGTTLALNAVELLPNDTGYIVGSSGRILKTTNAGAGWFTVASGTLESLFGVHFTNAQSGTVVGSSGKVLNTTNGGYTWSQPMSWTQDALFHVIRDGDRGLLCGDAGTVSFTTDGGQSWTDRVSGTSVALFHLTHPAPDEYAAVGEDGVILRTSDFGQTWVREISHAQHTLYSADAHGGNVYVVGDYGTALRNGSYPFPVELRLFTAERRHDCVLLRWETEQEVALFGYAIERNIGGGWQESGFVLPGHSDYSWRDCAAPAARVHYRLRIVDMDGTWTYSPEISVAGLPAAMALQLEVFPQPARGDVQVRVPESVRRLHVYDFSGRLRITIPIAAAAAHEFTLQGDVFPTSGMYVLVAEEAGGITATTIQVLK